MKLKQYMKYLRYLMSALPVPLSGCRQAPAFNVLGSYFPAWLFCFVLGILLTIGARVLLRKYNLIDALNPPLLMYSCLTAFFTCATWLIFFRS